MKIQTTLALVLALSAFGCESKKEEAPAAPPPTAVPPTPPPPATAAPVATAPAPDLKMATDAAELANKIEQTPADAEKILGSAGTTRDAFIEKLYTIAEDPLLAAEYARLYQPKQAG